MPSCIGSAKANLAWVAWCQGNLTEVAVVLRRDSFLSGFSLKDSFNLAMSFQITETGPIRQIGPVQLDAVIRLGLRGLPVCYCVGS